MHPPQFKKKSKAKISFTESDPALFEIDEANKRLRLPKLGWVKCRFSRHIEGKPNSVTVNWNGRHWMVSVQSKVEMADPQHPSDTIVAGDFGIVRRVTFSDGVVVPPIDVSWEEHRKKFYQRGLRNKRKFSQSWKKIVSKISKLDRRIANIRKDETHKFTSAYRYRAGGFRHQEHVGVSRREHGETGKESQTEVRVEPCPASPRLGRTRSSVRVQTTLARRPCGVPVGSVQQPKLPEMLLSLATKSQNTR
jgi:hypothetical protein